METFTEMFQAMIDHLNRGHRCHITHWHGIHREQFGVLFEGTLVSPRVEDVLCIYACGTFQCACCKQFTAMGTTQMPAFNANIGGMMCRECVVPGTSGITYLQIRMATSLELPPSPYHIYTDERPKTDIEKIGRWAHYEAVCRGAAHVHDMVYLNGKTIAHVRAELLAKRVICKWRKFVQRQNAAKMFQVLYNCCNIGLDASIMLAKKTCILSC